MLYFIVLDRRSRFNCCNRSWTRHDRRGPIVLLRRRIRQRQLPLAADIGYGVGAASQRHPTARRRRHIGTCHDVILRLRRTDEREGDRAVVIVGDARNRVGSAARNDCRGEAETHLIARCDDAVLARILGCGRRPNRRGIEVARNPPQKLKAHNHVSCPEWPRIESPPGHRRH